MPYGPRADRLLKKLGAMVGRQSLRVTANSPTIVVSGNFRMSYLKIILPRKWWNSKLHDWFLICSSLSDKRRNAAVLQAYISRETGRWGPLLTNSTVLVHGFARFFSLKANTINWLERLTQGAPPSNTVTQVDHCVWRKKNVWSLFLGIDTAHRRFRATSAQGTIRPHRTPLAPKKGVQWSAGCTDIQCQKCAQAGSE